MRRLFGWIAASCVGAGCASIPAQAPAAAPLPPAIAPARAARPASGGLEAAVSDYLARMGPVPAPAPAAQHLDIPALLAAADSQTNLKEVTVKAAAYKEEQPVGPNKQPEWTTRRRFLTTRAYVRAPGQVEFESWWKGQWPKGEGPNHLFQEEVSFGLPHRFQVDLYGNLVHANGRTEWDGEQIEVRWALAEWGKIPLNPTLYAEWHFQRGGADRYELRFLYAEEVGLGWHWAANLAYEQQVGGPRDREFAFSQAISRTIVDEKFAIGAEMKIETVTSAGSRGERTWEIDAGPSLQWRPTPRIHVDLVPLVGLSKDSPRVETWLVFGINLGKEPQPSFGRSPVSTQSR